MSGDDKTEDIKGVFKEVKEGITADFAIREKIRGICSELEDRLRDVQSTLQEVHHEKGVSQVDTICAKFDKEFCDVQNGFQSLASMITLSEYYKHHELFRSNAQKAAFVIAFRHYLQTQQLIPHELAAKKLKIHSNPSDGFHLDLEDYLHGVLNLATELKRLAMNCVTFGDYERPVQIATFISSLDSGFRLLNLKNDSLRRRFDVLKYDVQRAEEIVYDLSIRGLLNKEPVE